LPLQSFHISYSSAIVHSRLQYGTTTTTCDGICYTGTYTVVVVPVRRSSFVISVTKRVGKQKRNENAQISFSHTYASHGAGTGTTYSIIMSPRARVLDEDLLTEFPLQSPGASLGLGNAWVAGLGRGLLVGTERMGPPQQSRFEELSCSPLS